MDISLFTQMFVILYSCIKEKRYLIRIIEMLLKFQSECFQESLKCI